MGDVMSMCRIVPIPGFPTYEISDCGGIRHKHQRWGYRWRKPQVRKTGGYLSMMFLRAGKPVNILIHRLVALAFLKPPSPDRREVAHIDGNRRNNHVSNLRWSTRSENMQDAVRHGTVIGNKRKRLTENEVREIRRARSEGLTIAAIVERFGVSMGNADAIIHRRTWRDLV